MTYTRPIIAVFLLLASACASESNEGATLDAPTTTDSVTTETVATDSSTTDITDVPEETCDPGTGCFLETCKDNADCESAWCVPHQGERVCSKLCTTSCPDGWACSPVALPGADMAFICVSNYSHLCRPCATNADCSGPGSTETVCVDYEGQGSFCGGACGGSFTECPWGYSCQNTTTVDGIPTKQCVANAGVCICTTTAIELSLFTPCSVETDVGICTGTRYCSEEGLTDCDAGTPSEEVCNGLDDDCNGATDDGSCDDKNDCTVDVCDPETGCQNVAVASGECSDGNPCTAADHCENGACVGTTVICDDDNLCTDDVCTPEGGCDNNPNTIPCDDEDPCTVVDTCTNGACTGLALECDCHVDEDCAVFEDGNLCNGTLRCENTALPYRCVVDSDTIIDCADQPASGSICAELQCIPVTGLCEVLPANEGHPCEDGDLCTDGDSCVSGTCVSGPETNCNDGNVCTQDVCDNTDGCQHTAINFACIDGNACTIGDTCSNGNCNPGAPVDCDDNNPCTDDTCDPEKGCQHTANSANCDDGNECTTGDICSGGICSSPTNTVCDDGNACTDDACDFDTGCTHVHNTKPCTDGDVCTTGDSCSGGACSGSSALQCDDGNPCTDDTCTHPGGCLHTPNTATCNDGNVCTTSDQCAGGACSGSGVKDCDDGNVCTTDYCKPGKGCEHQGTTNPCDDGDECTNGDTCDGATCISGPSFSCDDSNECTKDECNSATGQCVFTPHESACDDGNPCSTGDTCLNGKCTSSDIFDCDEGNPCTIDICDPTQGCLHTDTTDPCEDNNPCTINDQCTGGSCTGQELNCNDGNPCTADSCIPGAGCTNAPSPGPCDDGNPCTLDDACIAGQCKAGGKVENCDDGNVCTADICDPILGCKHVAVPGTCSDNDLCTANDQCQAGVCLGQPSLCDDNNLCTTDSCDSQKGCDFAPNLLPCDDGNDCTEADSCLNKNCTAGTAVDCDDGDDCTDDSCNSTLGCVHNPVTPCCGNQSVEATEQCDDGNAIETDDCDSACQYTYTVVGQYGLGSGPNWSTNPTPVSCVETCAIVFGGAASEYACATTNSVLDHKAYLDGWNDTQFCVTPTDDDFKKGTSYDCGSVGCSYSAYVEDHTENNPGSVCNKANWCWKRK